MPTLVWFEDKSRIEGGIKLASLVSSQSLYELIHNLREDGGLFIGTGHPAEGRVNGEMVTFYSTRQWVPAHRIVSMYEVDDPAPQAYTGKTRRLA